jgi:hypothetical protein
VAVWQDARVLVFNWAGLVVLATAIAAWVIPQLVGEDALRLIAGFAAMTVAGIALELQPRPSWRPRYFWIIPAWLTGLGGTGLALDDLGYATIGYVVFGAAAAATAALLGYAIVKKPGGRWLLGVVAASTIVIGFQIIGYARPQWKHPVLYGVNAVALVAVVFCAVKLYRARRAA